MAFKKLFTVAFFGAAIGLAGLGNLALAQSHPPETPVIVSPATGATVSNPVAVSFSLATPPATAATPATPASGVAAGTKSPHAVLVIDAPLPAAGSAVPTDAQHIAFPKGTTDLSVTLAPGQHQLQIVFVNHKGDVLKRFQPGAAVTISVK